MKLTNMSVDALEAERTKTDAEILQMKSKGAPEDGPRLAALRKRRAELIAEITTRSPLLAVAA
jgi:hypothetical protein